MSKKVYPKEVVLNTALSLSKQVGIDKLSIRGIAKKMNTSVSPVYDAFDSKENIVLAVINTVLDQNSEKLSYFDRNLDILEHGLNYPKLYRDMQNYTRKHKIITNHYEDVIALMRKEPKLETLTEKALESLNFDILIYISGLVHLSESIKNDTYNNAFFKQILSQATERMILGYIEAIKEEHP